MDKKALIILAPGFEDIEAATCINVLRRGKVEVIIAGLNDLKVLGARGINILADKKLSPEDAQTDACILPGGSQGAKNLASSQLVKDILLKMAAENKIIAAICASPAIVLSPLGILRDKAATCYPGMQEHFNKDTAFKDSEVVVDGNIITSQGPATTMPFAVKILEKLTNKSIAQEVSSDLLMR